MIPHADFIDIPPVPEEGEDEPRAAPSYVIVYGKAPIPRFIVLTNISSIEFHKEPA